VAAERKTLTLEDREDISRGLAKGLPNKDIAQSIKRDESVVSREIQRHGGRAGYRAWKADAAARESRTRPKERKIDADRKALRIVSLIRPTRKGVSRAGLGSK
jgi:IS30 family transposase